MPVRFLLGPAGSGKTFRCLGEIRAALRRAPDGPPLLLLAPKQATFQLERQLLAEPDISGYARLHILSFDRLAQFILNQLNCADPPPLSDEGRVMVIRTLLLRHGTGLKLFRESARRPGFAQELSGSFAEFQQHQCSSARLRTLGSRPGLPHELRDKLSDLVLLYEAYAAWLTGHGLPDTDQLLDFASAALRTEFDSGAATLKIQGLWLDGFAEMTPQELDLLAALIPFCDAARLAFCLDREPAAEAPRFSPGSTIARCFQQCRARLIDLPGGDVQVECFGRDPQKSRFDKNPALRRLEQDWWVPGRRSEAGNLPPPTGIQIVGCSEPEAEAVFAAREILAFVRAGNRYRDCAILVRQLDAYHKPLARTLRRYGVPFFIDRRESVTHHPLAELTRNALRTVAFDWRDNEDWFAALKTGFLVADEGQIDRLENAALENGWHGNQWRAPLPDESCERLRKIIWPPFENFHARLAAAQFKPGGEQLAQALRELWNALDVESTLANWTLAEDHSALADRPAAIHQTVWEQMNAWLDDLTLVFAGETLPLRDWLPVLEAGLASLTVGVIPPALDQVLVGAIDRSRNPDLKFALILGVNESVFPATPSQPLILTDADRDELGHQSVLLGPDRFDQLAREHYLGYIACTRARERLAITFAHQDAGGRTLNPSPFIARLQAVFPGLEPGEFSLPADWREANHASELIPPLVQWQPAGSSPANWTGLLELPVLKKLAAQLARLREPARDERLTPALAEKLHGSILNSSVSRLEEFAQCPFRFFIHSGLRAAERKLFELDARERGSFQHEVLRQFHEGLDAAGRRWRELSPPEAQDRVGTIAAGLMASYRDGLLQVDAKSRFTARMLTEALQEFIGILVGWMHGQYEFDPVKSELDFGFQDSPAPAWVIELEHGHRLALRGRIDRIDLCRVGGQSLCVVIDYKSSPRKLDKLLMEHGVQLQLLAYLSVVASWPATVLGAGPVVPAGVFYVNLNGRFVGGRSRTEALADAAAAGRLAYRHSGRFDASRLDQLDRLRAGDQFHYQLNQDGRVRSNSAEAWSAAEFAKWSGRVEIQLRAMGDRIFSGEATVDPYRQGGTTACDYCDYRAACRIDPWTQPWRVLRAARETASPASTSPSMDRARDEHEKP